MIKVLVSSCLLGVPVRYNGRDKKSNHPVLERWIAEGRVVAACPEMLGGLGTPRPPAEMLLAEQRVVTDAGTDVTAAFVLGAQEAVRIAGEHAVRVAILKENSPSCGSSYVYDGTFTGTRLVGEGMATARLRERGVTVFSEEQLEAADAFVRALERD